MSYSDSLRQQAKWVREALDDDFDPLMKITLDDIDVDELDAAADHIDALVKALTELSNMYANTWDRADGGLMMLDKGVERFEKAHHTAQVLLCTINGTPLPYSGEDDEPCAVGNPREAGK